MGNCFSCDVAAGKKNGLQDLKYVVELDGGWILDHNSDEKSYLGYLILATKKHVEDLDKLSLEQASTLGINIKRINYSLKKYWLANFDDVIERIHIAYLNEGPFIAKDMNGSHVHFHIVPRTKKMIPDYNGDKIGLHLLEYFDKFPDYLRKSDTNKKELMIYLKYSLNSKKQPF
jgi:diadenosine tetraphosphate (Ap4A) HIT family hydrolase